MGFLFLGDSHLAYLVRDHPDLVTAGLGDAVTCRAFGGAIVADLPGQVRGLDLNAFDAVVVSVGTNDLFMGVSGRELATKLDAFMSSHPGVRWVCLESPNFPHPTSSLAVAVQTRDQLAPLGDAAFVGDGVHLSRRAYETLVPAIADAVDSVRLR